MSKESADAALGKFAEAVNTGKFDVFDQVVASNCVDHDPADWKRWTERMAGAAGRLAGARA